MNFNHRLLATSILVFACLAGCQSAGTVQEVQGTPKSELPFLDIQGFDRDLSASLAVPLPKVDVVFYDTVAPSAIPPRLQTWLSSVEAGGGAVRVTPPKSDITPKDPFLLMSLLSSVWNASKLAKDAALKAEFRPAQLFDAEIVLKKNDQGNAVIDRLVFHRRSN